MWLRGKFWNYFGFMVLFLLMFSCNKTSKKIDKQFELLTKEQTNINFQNILTENDSLNYFSYSYLYMGGGVAKETSSLKILPKKLVFLEIQDGIPV